MNDFLKQSTSFSCGATALKNCLTALGIVSSEETIREQAGTTKAKGTSPEGLKKAIKYYDCEYDEIKTENPSAFLVRLARGLKKGKVFIVLTDHEEHWISLIEYKARKFVTIDPEEKQYLEKHLTGKQLVDWCKNFNKKKYYTYFYAIKINP